MTVPKSTEVLQVVFITPPAGFDAEGFATLLVDEGLVACVNLIRGVRSVYRYGGETCVDEETLCVVKLPAANFDAMCARVCELHPAEVPEIIALDVDRGLPAYLEWALHPTRRPPD